MGKSDSLFLSAQTNFNSLFESEYGIPENDQPKLFTEFFRAGNVENIQGTGLGLSIVKKYTELLNGSIDFVSKPGDGTTFSLQLPADG